LFYKPIPQGFLIIKNHVKPDKFKIKSILNSIPPIPFEISDLLITIEEENTNCIYIAFKYEDLTIISKRHSLRYIDINKISKNISIEIKWFNETFLHTPYPESYLSIYIIDKITIDCGYEIENVPQLYDFINNILMLYPDRRSALKHLNTFSGQDLVDKIKNTPNIL